jgi:Uma2 family endonuclease
MVSDDCMENQVMATVEQLQREPAVVLHGISWQMYSKLRGVPDSENIRMTYDHGELEIMSPSKMHEQYASLIARLIEAWTEEWGIDVQSCRAMTCRRKELKRGFEPDNCYYIANEALMRDREELDLRSDPPPDLAIEIDLSRGRKKLEIYAAFRVPEVWWFDGQTLRIFVLGAEERYEERQASLSFPNLLPAKIESVLGKLGTASETALVKSFRDWTRASRG